jgi:hypothetical protein
MRARSIVGLALTAAAQCACGKSRNEQASVAGVDRPCGPYQCDNIDDGVEKGVLGGLVRVRSFGAPCVLTVAWPFWQETVYAFQARIVAHKGDVFPSRAGLVELVDCDWVDPRGRPGNELPILHSATLFLDQNELPNDAAISPSDVFIPLKGDAALDSGWVATAQLVGSGGQDSEPSAAIAVAHRSDAPVAHPALRVGDSFPWSDRLATLVRIVEPRPPHIAGWIELRVSSPPAASGR